jgi:hypothetical protein
LRFARRKNGGRQTLGWFLPAPISGFLPACRPPAAGQGIKVFLLAFFLSIA